MTKNNGKDYEKCYNKEHIADMKVDFLSGAELANNQYVARCREHA